MDELLQNLGFSSVNQTEVQNQDNSQGQVSESQPNETKVEPQVSLQPKDETEELKLFAKLYDEFKKDPYGFIVRNVPELIPADDYSWIKKVLDKEFGSEFTPDPNEVFIPGTKSNLYFLRQQELMTQYKQSIEQRKMQEEIRRKQFEEKFNREKQEIMSKYGIDENAFNEFWNALENTEISLEILYKGLYFDKLVEKIRQEIAEQIRNEMNSKIPPSPNQVPSAGTLADKDLADFGFF